ILAVEVGLLRPLGAWTEQPQLYRQNPKGAQQSSSLRVINPHRRRPRQLAVLLPHADIVVVNAGVWFRILPLALVLRTLWPKDLGDLAVLDDVDADNRTRAGDADAQDRRLLGLEFITHQMVATAHIENDVIRRSVAVPLLERGEDAGAIVLLGHATQ